MAKVGAITAMQGLSLLQAMRRKRTLNTQHADRITRVRAVLTMGVANLFSDIAAKAGIKSETSERAPSR